MDVDDQRQAAAGESAEQTSSISREPSPLLEDHATGQTRHMSEPPRELPKVRVLTAHAPLQHNVSR